METDKTQQEKNLLRHPVSIIALVFLGAMIVLAVTGSYLTKRSQVLTEKDKMRILGSLSTSSPLTEEEKSEVLGGLQVGTTSPEEMARLMSEVKVAPVVESYGIIEFLKGN